MESLQTLIAVIRSELDSLIKRADHFVTDTEFTPVKNITYGLVFAVLTAVLGAILSLVIK